ncbi:hypothetical protein N2152v2_006496 [Parachlorella kessleri]
MTKARRTCRLPNGLQLHYVSRLDVDFLWKEVRQDKVHLQHGVRVGAGDVVLDVGANIGLFAQCAAELVGPEVQGVVVAAEPLPASFAALQANVQKHRDWCHCQGVPCGTIEAVNTGVADGRSIMATFTLYERAAGWGTMHVDEEEVLLDMGVFLENALEPKAHMPSALSMPIRLLGQALRRWGPPGLYEAVWRQAVRHMLGRRQVTECPLCTVSDLIDDYSLTKVDLLKVDVERAELEVLRGVSQRHWPLIRQVVAEVHDANLAPVLCLLREQAGFSKVVVEQEWDLRGTSLHMVYCLREHVQAVRGAVVRQRHAPSSRLWAPAATAKSTENGVDNLPAADTGGSGGDIGDNGSGGGGGGSSNNPGFSGHMWSLLALAGAAWAIFQAYQRTKQLDSEGRGFFGGPKQGAPSTPSEEAEVVVLKRLVQEAFADLVKVRSRLEELEDATGVGEGSGLAADPDATPLSSGSGGSGGKSRAAGPAAAAAVRPKHPRHHLGGLSGSLELGGGVLWAPEEVTPGELLPAAGVRLGAELTLKLRGLARGGKDAVFAECQLSPATEQFSLKKVLYLCQLAPALRVALAPFGATAQDTAYTLNPLAGQGLSGMIKHGSPMHQQPLGSLVGATVDLKRAWASAGYSLQGLESGGVRTAVLGQAILAPTNTLSVGLSTLHHPPLAASDSTSATAGTTPRPVLTPRGGSILPSPRMAASAGAGSSGFTPRTPLDGAGAPAGPAVGAVGAPGSTQVAAMFAWRPDPDVVLHGWAASDRTVLERSVRSRGVRGLQSDHWGFSVGSYPDGTGNGWAVGLGRSPAVAAAAAAASGGVTSSNGSGDSGGPNLFELSLQFSVGEGMLVTPGVLCAVHEERTTLFAGVKTSWEW